MKLHEWLATAKYEDADWQPVLPPLPVGEWIDEPTTEILHQVPEGARVWWEVQTREGLYPINSAKAIDCWTTEGWKNLAGDLEQTRFMILPKPEAQE